MAIPDFIDGYHLPNGEHSCTFEEIEQTFLTTDQRTKVWSLFLSLFDRLITLGLQPESILIDGSFVTGREQPGDVDACVLISPQTVTQALDAISDPHDKKAIEVLTIPVPMHEDIVRTMFGAHLLVARNEQDLQRWSKFFRRGRHGKLRDPDPDRDPKWVKRPNSKGILRIDFPKETGVTK